MPISCLIMQDPNPLERLFASAKIHGVPMSRLCEEAGVDPTTPSRWKRGKTKPTLEKLMDLQGALDRIVRQAA